MINFRERLKLWSPHPCHCFVDALPCVPPQSHLCNSISVLRRVLIDLFRRSTKWLAKSHSFFPSLLLLLHPTQACLWHTVLFIILSLICSSCLSLVLSHVLSHRLLCILHSYYNSLKLHCTVFKTQQPS